MTNTPELRSVLTNGAYLLIAVGAVQVLRVLYMVLAARALGSEQYGLLIFAQSLYLALLPFAALGVSRVLQVEIARCRRRGEQIVVEGFALRTTAAVLVALLCASWPMHPGSGDATRLLVQLFAGALVFRAIAGLAQDLFVAYESARTVAGLELVFRVLEVVLAVAVLLRGGDVIGLAIVHLVVWLAQAITALVILKQWFVRPRWRLSGQHMLLLLRRGLPIGAGAVFAAWLLQGPVILFEQTGAQPTTIAQLGLAMQALLVLGPLAWVVTSSALPVLSRMVAHGDPRVMTYLHAMLRLGWFGAAAASLLALVYGPWLIGAVFGPGYERAGALLPLVLCLFGPWLGGSVASALLIADGRRVMVLVAALAGSLALTFVGLVAGPRIGDTGLVLGAAVGLGLWAIVQVGYLARLGLARLSSGLLLPVAICAGIAALFIGVLPLGGGSAPVLLALLGVFAGYLLSAPAGERRLMFRLLEARRLPWGCILSKGAARRTR